jgi:ribosomal protein L3
MLGVFAKTKFDNEQGGEVGLPPKRDIKEFRVRDKDALVPVGRTIDASWFQVGQFVDAKSNNKGKQFAGVSDMFRQA